MLAMACESKRTGDLFGNKDLFARASKIVGGLKAQQSDGNRPHPNVPAG
jgi:hypothetical protein